MAVDVHRTPLEQLSLITQKHIVFISISDICEINGKLLAFGFLFYKGHSAFRTLTRFITGHFRMHGTAI
jgi:hypothetical protein